ncbi:MAG: hypothetical protein A3K19_04650 [Lentisphaerae bacterium RIFOXYB12_FULL_65_16]|nr:MAG: hypothetical protein A3K18_01300 [Lentisphaerae bacterium RIFOXYA12_64_32]OGV84608.1 MAG: hypothetical protein A3K19_04650 [Lentisphaerae bacterium RIFOXYB12_FULL_65_16]
MDFSFIDSADRTDTGRLRLHNEDAVLRLPEHGIFGVADGIGGAMGGEMASRTVMQSLHEEFVGTEGEGSVGSLEAGVAAVNRATARANACIRAQAEAWGTTGVGTTVVIMVFGVRPGGGAAILHAGDSRAYRMRRGELRQLTVDHSVAAAFGMESEETLPRVFRGVITRAVGMSPDVTLEETPVEVVPGDLFLVCSDGLTRMVRVGELGRVLAEERDGDLQALAERLVAMANEAGGEDNVSVVLVRVAKNDTTTVSAG